MYNPSYREECCALEGSICFFASWGGGGNGTAPLPLPSSHWFSLFVPLLKVLCCFFTPCDFPSRLEGSASGSKVKTKRKKPRPEDRENSTVLANTPSPVGGCRGNNEPSSGGGKRSGRRGNGRPKRRRLSHSTYSITVDEDSLDLESSDRAKVTTVVVIQPLTVQQLL